MPPLKNPIGCEIARLRKERGLSQSQLQVKTGWKTPGGSGDLISRIERGDRKQTEKLVSQILIKGLNIPITKASEIIARIFIQDICSRHRIDGVFTDEKIFIQFNQ